MSTLVVVAICVAYMAGASAALALARGERLQSGAVTFTGFFLAITIALHAFR